MSNIAIRSKALLKTRFAVGGLSLLFASTFAFSPAFGDNYAQTISGGTGITQPVCSIAKVSELSLASQLNLIATPASDFSSSCGGSGNNGGGGGGAGEHSFEVDPALQGTGFEQYAGDLVVVPQTGGGMRAFSERQDRKPAGVRCSCVCRRSRPADRRLINRDAVFGSLALWW